MSSDTFEAGAALQTWPLDGPEEEEADPANLGENAVSAPREPVDLCMLYRNGQPVSRSRMAREKTARVGRERIDETTLPVARRFDVPDHA